MRTALVAALALVTGCGGGELVPGSFTTRCGVTYRGAADNAVTSAESDEYAVNVVQAQEDLAIAYGLVKCEQLQGVSIYTRPEPWRYAGGPRVDGRTFCDPFWRRIEVEITNTYALLHEFHHIAQNCLPIGPIDQGRDFEHSNWDRTKAYSRIDRAATWYSVLRWRAASKRPSPYSDADLASFAPTQADKDLAE